GHQQPPSEEGEAQHIAKPVEVRPLPVACFAQVGVGPEYFPELLGPALQRWCRELRVAVIQLRTTLVELALLNVGQEGRSSILLNFVVNNGCDQQFADYRSPVGEHRSPSR